MDPIKALAELRRIAAAILAIDDAQDYPDIVSMGEQSALASEMAEHFQALDGWLTKGGFSPWVERKKNRTGLFPESKN